MTRPRTFYAIVMDSKGTTVHQFATVYEQARFVLDCKAQQNCYAKGASATDPLVRKAKRAANQGYDWPQAV